MERPTKNFLLVVGGISLFFIAVVATVAPEQTQKQTQDGWVEIKSTNCSGVSFEYYRYFHSNTVSFPGSEFTFNKPVCYGCIDSFNINNEANYELKILGNTAFLDRPFIDNGYRTLGLIGYLIVYDVKKMTVTSDSFDFKKCEFDTSGIGKANKKIYLNGKREE